MRYTPKWIHLVSSLKVPPPDPYAEALIPSVVVLESTAFGRSWDVDEVMRLGPHDETSAHLRTQRDRSSLSAW